ncbi:MAG: putative ribonucleotide transport ATP-binding protein mkl [Planctomycetes bacterium]|nr:putative ribonucleotide transport ATP-binding protein mkl [Planctomycetota bacterium]
MSEDAPIRVEGLRIAFGDRVVLDGLDLAVPRGKTFVLMGLSGTGKSVTLKSIAGFLEPAAGRAFVDGTEVDPRDRASLRKVRSGMGYVFQHAALLRWMTALENVALPLVENGVEPAEAQSRATRRLEALGLGEAIDRYPDEMSGGMAKRVGFARATVTGAKVILYDEPTTGLDPITTRTVDELIVRGREEDGVTSVVVSHDVESAVRIGDLIGLLYEGRIQVVAPPREFLRHTHPVVREFVRGFRPQESST